MSAAGPSGTAGCDAALGCVFAKALLARAACCERAEGHTEGERVHLACTAPVAHTNCTTLAALLQERARFALRLPAPGRPPTHMQMLRLQCGGLAGLRQVLGSDEPDVHRLVMAAHERHGSLTELPWAALVTVLAAWQQPRRAGAAPAAPRTHDGE